MHVYVYVYVYVYVCMYIYIFVSNLQGLGDFGQFRPVKSTETFYTQDSIYPLYCVDTADA